MELLILNPFTLQGIPVEPNVPLLFEIFVCLPSVLDIVVGISALHPILIQIQLGMFSKYQVFIKPPFVFL